MPKNNVYSKSVVSNSQNVYIAEPLVGESDNVDDICFFPVVAWEVEYLTNVETRSFPCATPISIETLTADPVIYYPDSDDWFAPGECSGKGKESLKEHLQEIVNERKQLHEKYRQARKKRPPNSDPFLVA